MVIMILIITISPSQVGFIRTYLANHPKYSKQGEFKMIKLILRKVSIPMQSIFDIIGRKRNMQKMMVYCLKIKPNKLCAAYKI